MDWNHDGKIDYQDHAFYNNVIEPSSKNTSTQNTSPTRKTTSSKTSNSQGSFESSGQGWAIFIGICILYLFIKLIGG